MRASRVTNVDGSPYGIRFECPGCASTHVIPTTGPHAWGFNGSLERPTLTPSILAYPRKVFVDEDDYTKGTKEVPRCHSFVRDGRIEFCADSGHSLAGQTVDLPEITDAP